MNPKLGVLVPVLLACAALAASGCHDPDCRGPLSDGDVAKLQAKVKKGHDMCSELTRATLVLDDTGMLVNGAHVSFVPSEGSRQLVPLAVELLAPARTNWEKVHPGQPFVGTAVIDVPVEATIGAGVGVVASAESAKYKHLEIHSGDQSAIIDLWAGPALDHREVLRVERESSAKELRLKLGALAPVVAADTNEATALVDRDWGATAATTPRALVVRLPNGTFHDALALARSFLALPALAHAVVTFEVGRPARVPRP